MKTHLLIIVAAIAANTIVGQTNYINVCYDCGNINHDFNPNLPLDSSSYYFSIDSTQANNLWQTGIINKTFFNNGLYGPKGLVTDTINPYPINNLSSFQFSILNCDEIVQYECGSYQNAEVEIITKIHSESGKDGGTIEVSHNGSPFINIINDPMATVSGAIYSENDTIQSLGKPGYSGISDNWNFLNIYFQPEIVQSFDTLTLRFTFSSDSIQTNHDGWLIGVVSTSGSFLNIAEVQNDNLISISPNPTDDELRIYRTKLSNNSTIQILNSTGQVLYQNFHFMGDTIDTKFLADGIYLLNYSEANTFSVKKFIVQH